MEWNGNFGIENGRYQQNKTEVKTEDFIHTNSIIILGMIFTEKCILMLGSVKQYSQFSQKYLTSIIYVYYFLTNCGTLIVCIAQTVSFGICSFDAIADSFDRFGMFFILRLTIYQDINFFLSSSRKFVFAISSTFDLSFCFYFY